jgi:hypothetical protein
MGTPALGGTEIDEFLAGMNVVNPSAKGGLKLGGGRAVKAPNMEHPLFGIPNDFNRGGFGGRMDLEAIGKAGLPGRRPPCAASTTRCGVRFWSCRRMWWARGG